MKSHEGVGQRAEDHVVLSGADARWHSHWRERSDEVSSLAGPVLASDAFKRLGSITFLGILSPRFAEMCNSPLFKRGKLKSRRGLAYDGSRQSHSLGVALIALSAIRLLEQEHEIQKYAAVWGLLHDISTWPLSHTGEAAFENLTGKNTYDVRRMMILGDRAIPKSLRLTSALRETGIDADELLTLYDDPSQSRFRRLAELTNSPINPDVAEGIHRCGFTFGIDVPALWTIRNLLVLGIPYPGLSSTLVPKEHTKSVLLFWRKKGEVYRASINRPDAAYWESAWALAIMNAHGTMTVAESLSLSEAEIISRFAAGGVPISRRLWKWKPPNDYYVKQPRRRTVREGLPLGEMDLVLARKPASLSKQKRKERKHESERSGGDTERDGNGMPGPGR